MEELVKLASKNISLSILFFLGVYLPGFVTIFIKRYEIFKELDVFKISMLSIALALPSFVIMFFCIGVGFILYSCLLKKDVKEMLKEIYLYSAVGNAFVFFIYTQKSNLIISWYGIVKSTIGIGICLTVILLIDKFIENMKFFRKKSKKSGKEMEDK